MWHLYAGLKPYARFRVPSLFEIRESCDLRKAMRCSVENLWKTATLQNIFQNIFQYIFQNTFQNIFQTPIDCVGGDLGWCTPRSCPSASFPWVSSTSSSPLSSSWYPRHHNHHFTTLHFYTTFFFRGFVGGSGGGGGAEAPHRNTLNPSSSSPPTWPTLPQTTLPNPLNHPTILP